MDAFTEILTRGAALLGLTPDAAALTGFRTYYDFLEEKNRVMNLTAISGEEASAKLHFLDCLSLFALFDFKGASVIDVGSGAGFPGLPLKIVQPTIKLTLLDALNKRVEFLNQLCGRLNIDANCLHARAEEAALLPGSRDSYDFCVSRAVASLSVLSELCLPFVRPGGYFIAMKSVDTEEELSAAKSAIKALGGRTEKVYDYTVPLTEVTHRAVVVRKLTATPKGLPRRFAKIKKEPL